MDPEQPSCFHMILTLGMIDYNSFSLIFFCQIGGKFFKKTTSEPFGNPINPWEESFSVSQENDVWMLKSRQKSSPHF